MRVLKVTTQYNITDWVETDDEILLEAYKTMVPSIAESCKGLDHYLGTNIEVTHIVSINKEDC
jgi:hypothetical protein